MEKERKEETQNLARLRKDIEESKGQKVVLSSVKGKEIMKEREEEYEGVHQKDDDGEEEEEEDGDDDDDEESDIEEDRDYWSEKL